MLYIIHILILLATPVLAAMLARMRRRVVVARMAGSGSPRLSSTPPSPSSAT